jgi:hypothetical protein
MTETKFTCGKFVGFHGSVPSAIGILIRETGVEVPIGGNTRSPRHPTTTLSIHQNTKCMHAGTLNHDHQAQNLHLVLPDSA